MPALTRAAALTMAAGVGLASVLVSAPAALAASGPTVSGPTPESVTVGNYFKLTLGHLKKQSVANVRVPGLPSNKANYSCTTTTGSCTFKITVPKNATTPTSSSVDINAVDARGRAFTATRYVEWHTAKPSTAGTCTPTTSPLKTCTPTVLGPSPQSVKVGDPFRITVTGFKPGTTVTVTIPRFPAGERTYVCHIDATQSCIFVISVPLNVHAPG